MKRKILFLSLLLLLKITYSQVGIGTSNPRGALDINKPTTNNFGLVLPTNTGTEKISNPLGGNVAIGTIIYDSTADCIKVYKSTGWSNCLADNTFTLDCTNDLATGTYSQGVASNGGKIISYTGGNGQIYGAISIASTGVTGLTAEAAAGTLANSSGNITLNISGTPNTTGTAGFTVNLGGKSCTFTVDVKTNSPIVTGLSCNGALTGTYTQGVASNGSKIISYTGGNGKAYGAISIASTGVTGLTAKTSAGTLTNSSGNITLNISGTPNTTGTASFTVNLGGKSCSFTVDVKTNSPIVTGLSCNGALTGTYTQGVASNGSKIISYTGGNGKAYGAISIASTGVTGLTAKTSAGTLTNSSGNITLSISGTPNTTGTAGFTVNLGGKSCSFTVNVETNSPIVTGLSCNGALTGSYTPGKVSNGSKIISYTGGNGKAYGAISIASTGVTGLTAKTSAGTLANGNGNITLSISGTPNAAGTASFTANLGGKSCTFTVDIAPRTVKILSFEPDGWNSPLSSGNRTSVARSKLNKSSNFGPEGTVKIQGFTYTSINIKTASAQELKGSIDNADIIWVGYIKNIHFSAANKKVLEDKIGEGKKFFFISADGSNNDSFFPFPSFGEYEFVKTPKNQDIIKVTNANVGPTNGLFGTLAVNSIIYENLFKSGITSYPEGAIPFLITQNGKTNAIINNNLVIVGDLNWYINNVAGDGFHKGTSSCTDNNNSKLFCNILQKGIEYIQSH